MCRAIPNVSVWRLWSLIQPMPCSPIGTINISTVANKLIIPFLLAAAYWNKYSHTNMVLTYMCFQILGFVLTEISKVRVKLENKDDKYERIRINSMLMSFILEKFKIESTRFLIMHLLIFLLVNAR